ncbi:hypothetical protein [Streptomyces mayteni]
MTHALDHPTVFQRAGISCALCGHFLADAPGTRVVASAGLSACAPTCRTHQRIACRDTWPTTTTDAAVLLVLLAAVVLALLRPAAGAHPITVPGPCLATACSPARALA